MSKKKEITIKIPTDGTVVPRGRGFGRGPRSGKTSNLGKRDGTGPRGQAGICTRR